MSDIVKKEVIKLLKMGDKVKNKDLLQLREKYNDKELVKKIIETFRDKYELIRKNARRFATSIMHRYSVNTPYHILLEKARKHAEKFNMSDFEFNEFQKILEQEMAGIDTQKEELKPMTKIMKALGDMNYNITNLELDETEQKNLDEIIKLYKESKELHYYVILQSILNKNKIEPETTMATYDKNIDDINNPIHPLLVIMFAQKNTELESRFIYSNFTNIVYSRYKNKQFEVRSDYELFYDIINDPMDIVCNSNSTFGDLLYRANLQNQLWYNVLHLRNGKIYNSNFNKFMSAVDVCTLNKYVNPDFIYGTYDGTILRRLLSAFSYKPTFVATFDTKETIDITNPFHQNLVPKVTRIPVLTILVNDDSDKINIEDYFDDIEYQFILSDGVIVKKKIQLIYSRGNVFIHLNRQLKNIKLKDLQFNATRYPAGIEQFEKMSTKKMVFRDLDNIMVGKGKGNEYMVTGIVCNTTYRYNNVDYVTGDISFVRNIENNYYKYNPREGKLNIFEPITIDSIYNVNSTNSDSDKTLLENNSTIYLLSSKNMDENLSVKEL